MKRLATISRILKNICDYAGGILLGLMTLIVFAEVIGRYIFHVGYDFTAEICTFLMLWLVYLMIGAILKARQHVNIDMLPTKIPERYRVQLLIFFDVVSLIFAILLCLAGIKYSLVVKQLGVHSMTTLATPMWIVRLCIPLGGVFLALFSIDQLIGDIYCLATKHAGGKE